MSQQNLFQYFNPKNKQTPLSSPVTKKKTAIKSLEKITKKNEDDDFDLDFSSSADSDEEFEKVIQEKKLKKISGQKKIVQIKEPSSEEEVIKPIKSKSKKIKNENVKKNPSMESVSEMTSSISTDEVELPDWLTNNLRDEKKRKPTDPNYDSSTVFIPSSEENSFTPFQKQFWEIKKKNFDAVVMIRKGKFYEMFSIDALFARDVLKLRLTNRGKEPMCGVPEKAFSEWALKIINAGKRVCKVEQMETAVDQKNRKGGDKAIIRELVQVYSLGTIDDFEMLESSQPSFLMALKSSGRNNAGICLVDCSVGSFHMGVVNEDDLADVLIRFEPVEVIYHADSICSEHLNSIKYYCGNVATRAKSGIENWDGQLAFNSIQKIAGWEIIPEELEKYPKEAVAALGGCVSYLHEHKIAKSLLALKRFSSLEEIGGSRFLALDSSALTNLQIIGKDEYSLLKILDKCSTSFGKRKLRFWIMHPLRNIYQINQRLDALDELMKPEFINISKKMGLLPDLERMLSRVYSNRCNPRVFLDCLNALLKAAEFMSYFEDKVESNLLKILCPKGKGKSLEKQVNNIISDIDVDHSLESNELVVKSGVFNDIDEIENEISSIDNEFKLELNSIIKELKCKEIKYVHQMSERYQVEIPIEYTDDIDSKFVLVSQTKGVKRYHTEEILELLKKLEYVENERQKLRSNCQARFIAEFSKKSTLWDSTVESIAEIDCLISLANASQRWKASGFCRPKFVERNSSEANGKSILKFKQMRHPCLPGDCFPNDANISDKNILLITGPNASGKSTYARMCCISIVLAQIGCYLPGESAILTVYDQIFTRIGAGDRLFSGQSTFAVELSETARLMKHSTSESFVVLDELGRGTSTFDGIAIASAVLEHFITKIKCPLVFCTHYHVLAEQFDGHPLVRNASMKYDIRQKLTLLYQLVDGMCSSSFGCSVAALCGLPKKITDEAQEIADNFECRHKALHVTKSDIKIEVKELRHELKEFVEDIKQSLLGKKDSLSKFFSVAPIITNKINSLDLG